ncbi:MAG: Ubiquinone biosynthesis O-methyltransferase [Gammaproteobacteria bacterium]|nr:Ubiquinone biosynthesis O-methyltransferase [Gammaproteobacteria bacterium]
MAAINIDEDEIGKFDRIAARWWDASGPFRPLHDLNPIRVAFIEGCSALPGRHVIDVGCGGGLLTEAMARAGARVTGIDASAAAIDIARLHAQQADLTIDYRCTSAEQAAENLAGSGDVVTCMELLEHVPDPPGLLRSIANLLKPGGNAILSTINRTAAAYALGVIAAEYLMQILPRGTHDYRRFIRPSELGKWVRQAGLQVAAVSGIAYNPLTRSARLTRSVSVNYLMHCRRPAA